MDSNRVPDGITAGSRISSDSQPLASENHQDLPISPELGDPQRANAGMTREINDFAGGANDHVTENQVPVLKESTNDYTSRNPPPGAEGSLPREVYAHPCDSGTGQAPIEIYERHEVGTTTCPSMDPFNPLEVNADEESPAAKASSDNVPDVENDVSNGIANYRPSRELIDEASRGSATTVVAESPKPTVSRAPPPTPGDGSTTGKTSFGHRQCASLKDGIDVKVDLGSSSADSGGLSEYLLNTAKNIWKRSSQKHKMHEAIGQDPAVFLTWVSTMKCTGQEDGARKMNDLVNAFSRHRHPSMETATALLNNTGLQDVEADKFVEVLRLILYDGKSTVSGTVPDTSIQKRTATNSPLQSPASRAATTELNPSALSADEEGGVSQRRIDVMIPGSMDIHDRRDTQRATTLNVRCTTGTCDDRGGYEGAIATMKSGLLRTDHDNGGIDRATIKMISSATGTDDDRCDMQRSTNIMNTGTADMDNDRGDTEGAPDKMKSGDIEGATIKINLNKMDTDHISGDIEGTTVKMNTSTDEGKVENATVKPNPIMSGTDYDNDDLEETTVKMYPGKTCCDDDHDEGVTLQTNMNKRAIEDDHQGNHFHHPSATSGRSTSTPRLVKTVASSIGRHHFEELEKVCVPSEEKNDAGFSSQVEDPPMVNERHVKDSDGKVRKNAGNSMDDAEMSFKESAESCGDMDKAMLIKKQALTAAACRWIQGRWKDVKEFKKIEARRKTKGQDSSAMIVNLESLCIVVSALVTMSTFREGWISDALLRAITQTKFFKANDPVMLLDRLCDVIGARDSLPASVYGDLGKECHTGVTEGLAQNVSSLLRRRVEELIRGYIIRKASQPGPSGGPGKQALKAVRNHLDLSKHPWAVALVSEIAQSAACAPLGDRKSVEPDFDKLISRWEMWTFLLEWIESTEVFSGSVLDILAKNVRANVLGVHDKILDGSLLTGHIEKLARKVEPISNLVFTLKTANAPKGVSLEHQNWHEVSKLLACKLSSHRRSRETFTAILGEAETFANVYCPPIRVNGVQLMDNTIKLRRLLEEGTLPVRELSQAYVLSRISYPPEGCAANEVPLNQLQILSTSVVFADIWVSAGKSVSRNLHGNVDEEASLLEVKGLHDLRSDDALYDAQEFSGRDEHCDIDSQVSRDTCEDAEDTVDDILADSEYFDGHDQVDSRVQYDRDLTSSRKLQNLDELETSSADGEIRDVSLDIATTISQVIPLALERRDNLIDRIVSGTLPACKARSIFQDCSHDLEREVSLLFAEQVASTHSKRTSDIINRSPEAISQAVYRISRSISSHASITWLVGVVPALLRAHESLYKASYRSGLNATSNDRDTLTNSEIIDVGDEVGSSLSEIFAVIPSEDLSRRTLHNIWKKFSPRLENISVNEAIAAWNSAEDLVRGKSGGHRQHQPPRAKATVNDSGGDARDPPRVFEEQIMLKRCRPHVELLVALTNTPDLVQWLLENPSSEEFDKLHNVCRSLTDEPGLLSSIASLVEVRSSVLTVLFPQEPFNGLGDLLNTFSAVDLGYAHSAKTFATSGVKRSGGMTASTKASGISHEESLVWHVSNVTARFTSLIELFEKQTMSAGIQALKKLWDILDRGTFVLRVKTTPISIHAREVVLSLNLEGTCSGDGTQSTCPELDHENLLGLQARLAIMEVSGEEEKRWEEVWGHGARIAMDAMKAHLQVMAEIKETVKGLCDAGHPRYQQGWDMSHRFELDGLSTLTNTLQRFRTQDETWAKEIDVARGRWPCVNHLTMQDALRMNRFRLAVRNRCLMDLCSTDAAVSELPTEALSAIHSTLRLVSSGARREMAVRVMCLWVGPTADASNEEMRYVNILDGLGAALTTALEEEITSNGRLGFRTVPSPPPGTINRSDTLVASQKRIKTLRPYPDETHPNRGEQCLFATCATAEDEVIRVVLSIYVRRGRLPEPGEVIFCTPNTTSEELELTVRRFADRRKRNEGYNPTSTTTAPSSCDEGIFVIADVHRLDYSSQAMLLNHVRSRVLERDDGRGCGVEVGRRAGGAVLLVVSGKPRQAILTWLSDHVVEVPPLSTDMLKKAITFTLKHHYQGTTTVVKSRTNGGGKTHYIMKAVARAQSRSTNGRSQYFRVPVGESFSPREMLRAKELREILYQGDARHTLHLDLGHVPPPNCCTFLFQLLVEGCIRDPETREIIVRSPAADYFVEIPNSEDDRAARSLHVCELLPTVILEVGPAQLDQYMPVLVGTHIDVIPDEDTKRVCRWLWAFENGSLLGGDTARDPGQQDDESSSGEECFELLRRCCCVKGGPSERPTWALFRTFVRLLSHQLNDVEQYPLLCAAVAVDGLENFRYAFVGLLIECAKDFALRSMRQINLLPLEAEGGTNDSSNEKVGVSNPGMESRRLASRCQSMVGWEQSDHAVVVFKQERGGISGIDILSLNNSRRADKYINGVLKETLQHNGIEFDKDWTSITKEEGCKILRDVGGMTSQDDVDGALGIGYVFTVDNLLKMLSISLRLQAKMPVVIMGETGCGKSSLVSGMCAILGWTLHVLNVHSGLSYADIVEWVGKRASASFSDETRTSVVLLDEINACNSVGLFKEIVCDETVAGRPLPQNLRIVAACNPYRLRKGVRSGAPNNGSYPRMAGLASGLYDDIQDLVYRVHPLHESLVDHVMDYGSLSPDTERLYIKAMLQDRLKDDADTTGEGAARLILSQEVDVHVLDDGLQCPHIVETFARCLSAAQEATRAVGGGERATVSLRDVSRCIKVFIWLGRMWVRHGNDSLLGDHVTEAPRSLAGFLRGQREQEKRAVRKAMIMAMAYSYQARMERPEREMLAMDISKATFHDGGVPWLRLTPSIIKKTAKGVMKRTAEKMSLGKGVAANEALRENIFILLVSVLNSIPIFVVGKPGSSKSLAVSVLLANLRGRGSANAFLRSFPAVEAFFHQCSPQSTSQGILQTWNTARNYRRDAPNTVVITYLDEIGLAELSPHLPLKVLHKILDEAEPGETIVGISNWALDSAKMNRAVHLHRPAPTEKDLAFTAMGMLRSDSRGVSGQANTEDVLPKSMLDRLACAYAKVYSEQELPDFWGLREFYSLVRAVWHRTNREEVNTQRKKDIKGNLIKRGISALFVGKSHVTRANKTSGPFAEALAEAVLRNFGGRKPAETLAVLKVFFKVMLDNAHPHLQELPTVYNLIRDNLAEEQARHLMLLTKNNAALSLLFDLKLLDHSDSEVLFGSAFPGDVTDMQVSVDIQTVKACMARGGRVVLVHCEKLYESLYDLLNQHYTECAGKLFVRLAMGAQSQLCPLDPKFRVVVVVETVDAYERMASPLLNRFEKQILGWNQAVKLCQPKELFERLLTRARSLAKGLASRGTGKERPECATQADMRRTFPGYGTAFIPSLVLAVSELARDGAATICKHRSHRSGEVGNQLSTPKYSVAGLKGNKRFSSVPGDEDTLFEACLEMLLKVATPEAMCRLTGCNQASTVEVQRAADMFKRRAYGSLEELSKNILYRPSFHRVEVDLASSSSVVVMTYAPLEGDAAVQDLRIPTGGGWSVRHVVIHELSQERELRAKVKEFFSNESSEEVLLLQCDLQASPARMVEHVKFIVENERAAFIKDSGDDSTEGNRLTQRGSMVHVVLLLHLIRGDDNFLLTFDTRWTSHFVDSVGDGWSGPRGHTRLPTALDATGKSVLDVVSALDPSEVLMLVLRTSLSKLEFSPERLRDMAEVRAQMEVLLEACVGRTSPRFVAVTWEAVIRHLEQDPVTSCNVSHAKHLQRKGTNIDGGGWEEMKGEGLVEAKSEHQLVPERVDVAQAASSDHQLRVAGTFRRAIRASVLGAVTRAFTLVLAHMDRNVGILLLSEPMDMRDLWVDLFEISFKDMRDQIAALTTSRSCDLRGEGRIMVHDTRAGPGEALLRGSFPFSFYVLQLLQGLKNSTTVGRSEGDLQRSFALLRRGERLHGMLSREGVSFQGDTCEKSGDEAFLRRYVHDFTCMLVQSVRGVSRTDQAVYLLALLDAAGPGHHKQDIPSAEVGGRVLVRSLAAVHHRFWREEHAVRLHFKLLDAAGPRALQLALAEVLSRLQQTPKRLSVDGLDPILHMLVARAVMVALVDPEASFEQGKNGASSKIAVWALDVQNVDRATENLLQTLVLSHCDGNNRCKDNMQHALKQELLEGWARLRLMKRLVANVTTCLPLSPEEELFALRMLSHERNRVQSKEFLNTVVRALTFIANRTFCVLNDGDLRSRCSGPLWEVFPRFLECYLAENFFGFPEAKPEEVATIEDLCTDVEVGALCHALMAILSGNANVLNELWDQSCSLSHDKVPGVLEVVWPREATCVQGLRMLRKWSSDRKPAAAAVNDSLQAGLLREFYRACDSIRGNSLTICFVVAVEEDTTIDEARMFVNDTLARGRCLDEEVTGTEVKRALTLVACVRKLATAAAEALCKGEGFANNQLDVLLRALKVDGQRSSIASLVGGARNLGMFFLRQVVQSEAGGEEFLRRQLGLPPFNRFRWSKVDSRIAAFAASDKLPQVNPLTRIPYFERSRALLSVFMDTGNEADLETGMQRLADDAAAVNGQSLQLLPSINVIDHIVTTFSLQANPNLPAVPTCYLGRVPSELSSLTGGLLAAVFHEANLVKALGGLGDRAKICGHLRAWLSPESVSPALTFLSATKRRIILAFVGHTSDTVGCAFDMSAGARGALSLCLMSPTEDVVWARLAAHVAAAFLAAVPTSPMAFFADVATSPDDLQNAYIPAMDSTLTLKQIAAAGGKTHQCNCGFLYTITECGKPMQTRKCPAGCGGLLGGHNHKYAQDNAHRLRPQEVRGYFLQPSKVDHNAATDVRELSAIEVASTRLLTHLAGIVGAASAPKSWEDKAQAMLNAGQANFLAGVTMTGAFLHAARGDAADIRRLRKVNTEQMAMGLHLALLGTPAHNPRSAAVQNLQSEAGRTVWEEEFCLQHLRVLSDQASTVVKIKAFTDELRGAGEGAAFAAELLVDGESNGSRPFEPPMQQLAEIAEGNVGLLASNPAASSRLWQLRRPFSVRSFFNVFMSLGKGAIERLPLLTLLANGEETLPLRLALPHLPTAMKWVHILKKTFQGKVDREKASTWTAGSILDSNITSDRTLLLTVFHGFSEAWRHGRGLVKNFECEDVRIEKEYVDRNTPLSVFLPSLKGEGVYTLALLTHLVGEHNRIIGRAREVNATVGKEVEDIKPCHLVGHHAITLDIDRCAPLLRESQCDGTLTVRAAYDFGKAELRLAEATISGVPMIRMATEDLTFNFAGDGGGGGTLLGKLGKKIFQRNLARGDREAIMRDLSTPALAQSLLNTIEPAMGIISSVGGNLVQALPEETAQTMLVDFLQDVLRMEGGGGEGRRDRDGIFVPPSVSRFVRLENLVDLWELAKSLTETDWTSAVSQRFREELPVDLALEVENAGNAMGPELELFLPMLKDYIRTYLIEDDTTTSASSTVKDNLHWLQVGDVPLGDLDWFVKSWPGTIQMRHALGVFKVLKDLAVTK